MKTALIKFRLAAIIFASTLVTARAFTVGAGTPKHNVLIFVADGLRGGSVNASNAPEMFRLENEGVRFANSHSLFPTVTTANASAIATGHALGDTGDFGNALYVGYPVSIRDGASSLTPFLESDTVLNHLNARFDGNYLGQESLLACARRNGFLTAAIGKLGPILIQDVTQNAPGAATVIIDDWTGTPRGVPLSANVAAALNQIGFGTNTPPRGTNGFSGNYRTPGTLEANLAQQQYFADALTKVVLPAFKSVGRPFVIVFWSRDPDGTQHNQGDSLNSLTPGINGPTARAGIRNADSNLAQIRAALRELGLEATTDIFVTADHGFDTISKSQIDAAGTMTKSRSAEFIYHDKNGNPEVGSHCLPNGFLAIDLALRLKQPLYDPDQTDDHVSYKSLFDGANPPASRMLTRPVSGNGLIGGKGRIPAKANDTADAEVVVTANGGADFIYLPNDPSGTNPLASEIVNFLTTQDYVSGVFVNDKYGHVPGALNFSAIGLIGSAKTPRPAMIVNFCSFTTDTGDPLQHGVMVADTELQQGQGNHGGFDRAATFNFMAACGPDFKSHCVDPAPVSNADIAITFAQLLGLEFAPGGSLTGRVMEEALLGGAAPAANAMQSGTSRSDTANGVQTILNWREFRGHRYFDAAGFPGRTLGLAP